MTAPGLPDARILEILPTQASPVQGEVGAALRRSEGL